MVVDILDPNYWISELIGNVLIFAVLLALLILYYTSKLKLNLQWTFSILMLAFLMLPIIFDGFLTWVPLIIIIVGIIVGFIFYRFLERT